MCVGHPLLSPHLVETHASIFTYKIAIMPYTAVKSYMSPMDLHLFHKYKLQNDCCKHFLMSLQATFTSEIVKIMRIWSTIQGLCLIQSFVHSGGRPYKCHDKISSFQLHFIVSSQGFQGFNYIILKENDLFNNHGI